MSIVYVVVVNKQVLLAHNHKETSMNYWQDSTGTDIDEDSAMTTYKLSH